MDKLAWMISDTFLYWNSVILTLAAGTAVCFFLYFYLVKGGSGIAAAVAVPFSFVLSLVLARLCHWYSRADSYASLGAAMTNFASGGYALMGAFAGCAVTAGLLRLLDLESKLFRLTDAMCLGGCAGISVGRLACFYSSADRGQILNAVTKLPWAYPVTNPVSGAVEYRLATFVIQAMVTGVIFLLLTAFFHNRRCKTGDITALFALLYGSAQIVLDSTRYDSLYLRSNGFISIVQILGAVAVAAVCVLFSLRLVRNRGFRKAYLPVWVLIAGLMGCAGYMEYHVQRHGDQAVFAYSVMSACLGAVCLLAVGMFFLGALRKTEEAKGEKQ